MSKFAPPKREEFECRAHWRDARTQFFKALKRKDTIEHADGAHGVGPLASVLGKLEQAEAALPKPSPAFVALMREGEEPVEARARLSAEYIQINDRITHGGARGGDLDRHTELHAIEYELRGH